MSNFKGDYLRILTPRTIDGNIPLLQDGEQQYKESHVPVTARKHLERENSKRPQHLQHIIEHVGVEPIEDVKQLAVKPPKKPRGPQPQKPKP